MIIEQIKNQSDKIFKKYHFRPDIGKLRTHPELARVMVYRLPEYLFISNETKFLDPCAGTGTFAIYLIERLMKYKSLKEALKQIYICELSISTKNAFLNYFLPKKKPFLNFKNDFLDSLISEMSEGKVKTLSDLSYIIYNEEIKNQILRMKLELTEFIERYEKVSKLESKLFGEVFTPKRLIEKMLDRLPKEIWKNKDLKWLDPAVGIGNFPSVIVEKLMIGLSDEIPSDSERYKWIMEEMIYMCDISTKNLFLLYRLFDENNKLNLNVFRGSFTSKEFKSHVKQVWGVDKFDVIIGNPPYNDELTSTGDNKLYLLFISESFKNFLTKDGYLLFVTPKKSIENLIDLSKNRNYVDEHKKIIFLSLDTPSKYFTVGSSFCYFLLQNRKDDGENFEIEFIDRENKIQSINSNIYRWKKVPKFLDSLTLSIIEKTIFLPGERFKFKVMKKNNNTNFRIRKKQIESKIVSKNETQEYKYKILDKIKSSGKTEYFIKEPMIDSNMKKVIFSQGGSYTFPLYDSGEYSCSDNLLYHLVDNETEGHLLVSFMNSKLLKFLESCLTKGIDMDFSYSIRNILKIDFIDMTNIESIYKFYGLTEEEINLIEKTIKD